MGIEVPVFIEPDAARRVRRRFGGSLGYEVVFLAVNDQPISLRLAGTGGFRDDLARSELHGWEVGGLASLRINLWAPPTEFAETHAAEAARAARPVTRRGAPAPVAPAAPGAGPAASP